jgi:transposase
MAALEQQLQTLEAELRRFAGSDRRCQALQTIYGVGPIIASHLLAEIGDVARFRWPSGERPRPTQPPARATSDASKRGTRSGPT